MMNRIRYTIFVLALPILWCCKEPYTPKPRSYFRIDFPERSYQTYSSPCNFSFEFPSIGTIRNAEFAGAQPCWYNINLKGYNATLYLTYKPVHNDLATHIEDVRKIVYKHIVKADDIQETPVAITRHNVYGLIYDIKGNAASSVNFYLTDSTSGFLSGSLYFNVAPNWDSLAPAIQYFRQDIVHLIETFTWDK